MRYFVRNYMQKSKPEENNATSLKIFKNYWKYIKTICMFNDAMASPLQGFKINKN